MKKFMSLAVFSVVVAMIFFANILAEEPSGRDVEILKRAASVYSGIKSYRDETTVKVLMSAQGMEQNIENKYDLAIEQPNKLAMIMRKGVTGVTVVCDGQKLVTYLLNPRMNMNKYVEEQAKPTIKDIIMNTMLKGGIMGGGLIFLSIFRDDPAKTMFGNASRVDLAGEEKIDNVTTKHLCVYDCSAGVTMLVNIWVGADSLIRKFNIDMSALIAKQPGVPDGAKLVFEELHSKVTVNRPISPDIFVFTPPAGAEKATSSSTEPAGEEGTSQEPKTYSLIGKPAGSFKIENVNGTTFNMSDCKGRVVVMDFWATWCGPCKHEMPIIQKIYNEYNTRGVVFIMVNAHEAKEKVEKFIKDANYSIPVGLDADGVVGQAYLVEAYPTLFLIDKNGVIQRVHIGLIPDLEERLKEDMDALLADKRLKP